MSTRPPIRGVHPRWPMDAIKRAPKQNVTNAAQRCGYRTCPVPYRPAVIGLGFIRLYHHNYLQDDALDHAANLYRGRRAREFSYKLLTDARAREEGYGPQLTTRRTRSLPFIHVRWLAVVPTPGPGATVILGTGSRKILPWAMAPHLDQNRDRMSRHLTAEPA